MRRNKATMYMSGGFVYDKGDTAVRKRMIFWIYIAVSTGYSFRKRMYFCFYLTLHKKITSKWVANLNERLNKAFEGGDLCDSGVGKDFFKKTGHNTNHTRRKLCHIRINIIIKNIMKKTTNRTVYTYIYTIIQIIYICNTYYIKSCLQNT